jgi:lipid A 3-O-deacylase
VPDGRVALGCSPLFRESGSIGVRLSANWSLLATVEHLSNAGLCDQNRGLTNIGARVGYSF